LILSIDESYVRYDTLGLSDMHTLIMLDRDPLIMLNRDVFKLWEQYELWNHSPKFAALMEKATAGDADSQYDVAAAHDHGDHGVKKDNQAAFEWYLRAAKQGHIEAQCAIAWAYKNGAGVKADNRLAFEWYMKAAEQGDAQAQYNVGKAYVNGEGVEKDLKKAAKWISTININEVYVDDKYKMNKYYFPSAAFMALKEQASAGDTEAQYNVGLSYDNGNGVKKNTKKAFEWYLKAAEQGHAKAQFNVGYSYSGVSCSGNYGGGGYTGHFGYYGDHGNNLYCDPTSDFYRSPFNFDTNYFFWRDAQKSFNWYLKAAEQGHVEAQYNVGVLYEYAEGVEQNLKQAFEWYLKAANQRHAKAQYDLAWAYENGRGVNRKRG